ncbi:hypothetical protein SKAU_G00289070 [Synaphobranchus kaupii]|uniref:Max-like protein X n=1 Tax=Synaphobranchus kaupii TaxID=118154 RepID=A0A9Q1ILW9_SYNKA|nr:hypothetical protein SKAU_G00289070 [Synaphobranchus kaupii]
MTETNASPEDLWSKQADGAFSDNGFDHSFFEGTRKGTVVSRANSIGSTSASSVPNTDDEDSDYRHEPSYKETYKDRRRQAHTQAEQKRRDAIKKGYDDLQSAVPTCQPQSEFAVGTQKISKATVLQKTIDYIQFLHKEKKKQEEEMSTLRKEVMALKIMKMNYEHIVKAHQDNPQQGEGQVSDQVKFGIFQNIMDCLFQSFSTSVSVTSFQELSACVFSWIEEHCEPQRLREFVVGVLQQLSGTSSPQLGSAGLLYDHISYPFKAIDVRGVSQFVTDEHLRYLQDCSCPDLFSCEQFYVKALCETTCR